MPVAHCYNPDEIFACEEVILGQRKETHPCRDCPLLSLRCPDDARERDYSSIYSILKPSRGTMYTPRTFFINRVIFLLFFSAGWPLISRKKYPAPLILALSSHRFPPGIVAVGTVARAHVAASSTFGAF